MHALNLSHPPHLTHQRKLVWDVLNDAQEHLDAESVYLRAKARSPNISLATVYRSLAYLKEAGLVQEHSLGENHHHYETTPAAPHQHFTCLGCGRVIELTAPQLDELVSQACTQQGMRILQLEIHMRGYCPDCRTPEVQA